MQTYLSDTTHYFFICYVMNGTDCVAISLCIDIYFTSFNLVKVVADTVYQEEIMKACHEEIGVSGF